MEYSEKYPNGRLGLRNTHVAATTRHFPLYLRLRMRSARPGPFRQVFSIGGHGKTSGWYMEPPKCTSYFGSNSRTPIVKLNVLVKDP